MIKCGCSAGIGNSICDARETGFVRGLDVDERSLRLFRLGDHRRCPRDLAAEDVKPRAANPTLGVLQM